MLCYLRCRWKEVGRIILRTRACEHPHTFAMVAWQWLFARTPRGDGKEASAVSRLWYNDSFAAFSVRPKVKIAMPVTAIVDC